MILYTKQTFIFAMLAAMSGMAMSGWTIAQEASGSDQEDHAVVKKWATETVGRLTLHNATTDQPLQIKEGSLLRWSNPIIGKVYGDSYLWMDQGRPAAFLSIYALFDSPEGNRRLTFQSLSKDNLTAMLDEEIIWRPNKPGIEYLPVEGVPSPRGNANLRRIQLRKITRQYAAEIAESKDDTRFRKLRLLTKPLLEYKSPKNNIDLGHLYAFVDGTDPELLLLVESYVQSDSRSWRIAPVRQNHRRLQFTQEGNVIWDAPALAPPFPNPKISDPAGVYFNSSWSTLAPNG